MHRSNCTDHTPQPDNCTGEIHTVKDSSAVYRFFFLSRVFKVRRRKQCKNKIFLSEKIYFPYFERLSLYFVYQIIVYLKLAELKRSYGSGHCMAFSVMGIVTRVHVVSLILFFPNQLMLPSRVTYKCSWLLPAVS